MTTLVAVSALGERVAALAPGVDVRVAFLDLCAPSVTEVLGEVSEAVVVPLLLGRAFHVMVDLPARIAEARAADPELRVRVAEALGPDEELAEATLRRLRDAGVDLADRSLGVVLAAAGTSSVRVTRGIVATVRRWEARHGWVASVAYAAPPASMAHLSVAAAVAAVRERGARRVVVGSWFLAPGLLPDRVMTSVREVEPSAVVAAPLAEDPMVAELILRRFATARQDESVPAG